MCVLHSVERCVCVLHSVERCVCVLHSVERHCLCTAQSRQCTAQCLSRLYSTHTYHGQICCHNTDYVHVNGHYRTITVILASTDDGSLVIRNMLEQF